ncbi:hypothetical protein EGI22_21525 [Lacihabitans sp. LS3-19]|uniref:LytR/AlgR family response regulator transcription factor n=1 Tax=Lacihabitans sp. LS3-19 TaxID=2487335 RepID=UPI0020CBC156|nr:LytTR family transcriptional regulator DNA-binding domain-containing protein [Lacihabitans sp. LS3-19]MCP9770497.1 hypothetical protein [Lacihabitans sp. LS3-19]
MKTNLKSNENSIHLGSRTQLLPRKILMLKADINYTEVFLTDGTKLLSSTTMGIIEKRLEDYNFFRANRSTIINLQYLDKDETIKELCSNLLIHTGKKREAVSIKISRRRKATFLAIINP